MRYILILFLCTFFAYALALVILNNNEIAVNLFFMQAPAMNLGLLLIICIVLGVFIGMLLALLMFKVLQNKWELSRLKKENDKLKGKLELKTVEVEKLTEAANAKANADSQISESSGNL